MVDQAAAAYRELEGRLVRWAQREDNLRVALVFGSFDPPLPADLPPEGDLREGRDLAISRETPYGQRVQVQVLGNLVDGHDRIWLVHCSESLLYLL